jgi:hypothetical protein
VSSTSVMAAGSERTLLREANQLRQMAANIRADGSRGAQAEVDCERPRSAQPLQRSTVAGSPWIERARSRRLQVEIGRAGAPRGGTDLRRECVDRSESKGKPRRVRSPAARPADKPVRLQIGVLAMEAASEADSTRVALVCRHGGARATVCKPQWRQVAVGDWLVLQQPNMHGVESSVPYEAHDLLVEVWSGLSTHDCTSTRDESDPSPRGKVSPHSPTPGPFVRRLGGLVVDCTTVCSGQGSIDRWFEISGTQGNTAAHVLLAVERHVSADVSRRVSSLPPGWDHTSVVDVAERVGEVADCIQRRRQRRRQSTARFAAAEATRPAGAHPTDWGSPHPVTGSENRGRDYNKEITVGVGLGMRALQHRSIQDGPLQAFHRRARDAGHSGPGDSGRITRGPLKQQRPRRDTVKRAPDGSPATTTSGVVRAPTTTAMAPSTTPRRRKREFALLNALL